MPHGAGVGPGKSWDRDYGKFTCSTPRTGTSIRERKRRRTSAREEQSQQNLGWDVTTTRPYPQMRKLEKTGLQGLILCRGSASLDNQKYRSVKWVTEKILCCLNSANFEG